MNESRNKSLQDLEKLYTKSRPVTMTEDTTYDTLKISKEELNKASNIPITIKTDDYDTYGGETLSPENDDLTHTIEARNLLTSNPQDAINYKYSTPVRSLRRVMRIWRVISIALLMILTFYLGINFWATVGVAEDFTADKVAWPMSWFSGLVEKDGDYLYWSYIISSILSVTGMIITLFAALMLSIERMSTWISWSARANSLSHQCFTWFTLIYIVGIVLKMITILFSDLENKGEEFLVQLIKGVLFGSAYLSWRRTIRLKFIHSEMINEVLELAKDNELLQQEIFENWEKIDD